VSLPRAAIQGVRCLLRNPRHRDAVARREVSLSCAPLARSTTPRRFSISWPGFGWPAADDRLREILAGPWPKLPPLIVVRVPSSPCFARDNADKSREWSACQSLVGITPQSAANGLCGECGGTKRRPAGIPPGNGGVEQAARCPGDQQPNRQNQQHLDREFAKSGM